MITIKKKLKQKNLIFFLFLAPSLVGFLMFYLVPFVISICYSFFDSPVNGSFVGLKNYTSLLSNGIFPKGGFKYPDFYCYLCSVKYAFLSIASNAFK